MLVGYQWNLSNDIHVGFIYESYMYVPVPLCEHIIGLGFGVTGCGIINQCVFILIYLDFNCCDKTFCTLT